MIPKHSEVIANADYESMLKQLAKARPRSPAIRKRLPKGQPQRIEGRGNFLVRQPPASTGFFPTEVGVRRDLGKKAAMVAQDGLLPTPMLDQRKMIFPVK